MVTEMRRWQLHWRRRKFCDNILVGIPGFISYASLEIGFVIPELLCNRQLYFFVHLIVTAFDYSGRTHELEPHSIHAIL